jgi:hypothetical protein
VIGQQGRDLPGGTPFIPLDLADRRKRTSYSLRQLLLRQIKGFPPPAHPTTKGYFFVIHSVSQSLV